jgi:type II secretory ATPase GspE/PulE/Tfp pilus assembly ATPase PilB-like protein
MVGEIRDSETAKIAVQSSLTGHLVFSTLHTNNAQGAIPRLIDLGINPKIITSSLTLSIAQRLLRKLCESCKQEKEPEPWERELIEKVLESIKKKRPDLIPANWANSQMGKIYKNVGCEKCHGTGFKGREGIFEAIVMDDAVASATITNPNEKEIKIAAVPQKILDMRQDGMLKVVRGETTIEEMGRVIDLYEEII